ncbi:MAG: outer membrane lipoprotein LolB, partial [Pseudomonadota bacterium]|nr:outer membrane lipoprotein LolB [Pseudomonadota bacterium]
MTLVTAVLAARMKGAARAFGMMHMMRIKQIKVGSGNARALAVSAALMAATLTGCASLAPAPVEPPSSNSAGVTRQRIAAVDIGGRLSVRYQKDGHEEAVHGSFTWSQRPGHTLITLLSPLGQTVATIELTPGQATLTQTGQAVRRESDADALAQNALGWPLPVAGLGDWLQGFAVDGAGRALILTSA